MFLKGRHWRSNNDPLLLKGNFKTFVGRATPVPVVTCGTFLINVVALLHIGQLGASLVNKWYVWR